ncbi:MAG: hypothetical protein IKP74_07530 [Clostridia bacterium]|nr:hypothetical protein [Clostridia bacterium]
MHKRILSLLLLLATVFSIFTLASCGEREKTPVATTTATKIGSGSDDATAGEETTAGTDKWEALAPKVTMIAARDRTLKIEYENYVNAEHAAKNDVYLEGPDAIEEGVTPKIRQLVYERNKAACELFGLTIEYEPWHLYYGQQGPKIQEVVQAKAADAPDLFVDMIYDLNNVLLTVGAFKDVWSIPGGFFDFNEKGWLTTWMENMSLTTDRAYILGSDYFLDLMCAITVLPFNLTMMDANAAKLSGAIIGADDDPLGTGENLSTRFFDLVDQGGWTWEVLGLLSEAIWEDTDGDGADSIRDRLGIIADEYGGVNAASFIYSCGEELTERYKIEDPADPNNGKWWIKYADTSAGLNKIFDAVKAVFDGSGSLSTNSGNHNGNTPENPGTAYHHTKFAAGETLFAGVCTLGALEDEVFQQMTEIYSVVPCPKADADNEYNTIIVNQGDAGAINVNSNPRKTRALSAYIQYCTENSPAIRHEFLETVTKYKTTTYNQGTDRMLDIIYDGILYGRDKAIDDLVNISRWHSMMKSQHFQAGSDYIVSEYEAARGNKQKKLDEIIDKWYSLPTVEAGE